MKKILCFLGWHTWTWVLTDNPVIFNCPPDNSKCKNCGITFSKTNGKQER